MYSHRLFNLFMAVIFSFSLLGVPVQVSAQDPVPYIVDPGASSVPGIVTAWGDDQFGQTNVPPDLHDAIAISSGWMAHALALKSDGTVVAWGCQDAYPNAGADRGQCDVPADLHDAIAIAAGERHSLALKSDGTVVAWGCGGWTNWGQCAVPSGLTGVVAISAASYQSLALKDDGTVVAWGCLDPYGNYGQCDVPADLSGVVAVSAGVWHSLALKSDGTVVAWGCQNANDPYADAGQCTVPADLNGVTGISAGLAHSLAVKNDGTVISWGCSPTHPFHEAGQCAVPQDLGGVTAVSAGAFHSVALKADGTMAVWGCQNDSPIGQIQCFSIWYADRITAISAGGALTMVIQEPLPAPQPPYRANGGVSPVPGIVRAWGAHDSGQTTIPAGLHKVTAVSAGAHHAMALKPDGTVAAWGCGAPNDFGQCAVPEGLLGVTAVAAGEYHSLALKDDGTVVAWGCLNGAPDEGQCDVPAGLDGIIAIAAASDMSLALRDDGTAVAWGCEGTGNYPNLCTKVQPSGAFPYALAGVVAISAGSEAGVALKSNGAAVTWGSQWPNPADMTGMIAVAEGAFHGLGLRNDGTVFAWGCEYGGDARACNVPAGLSGVTAIAAGESHNIALKIDGTVEAWGSNDIGETSVPEDLDHVTAIAAGTDFSLAIQEVMPQPAPSAFVIARSDAERLMAPNANKVEAVGWNMDDELKLTIHRPGDPPEPDYVKYGTVAEMASWDPTRTSLLFDVASDLTLQPGDEITVTNGVTSRMTTVASLPFSPHIDVIEQTVSGIADPGRLVNFTACFKQEPCIQRTVTADPDGNWTLEDLDLWPETRLRISVGDDASGYTRLDWQVPAPRIRARSNWDWVMGFRWHYGDTLTLKIYRGGKPDNENTPPDFTTTGTVTDFDEAEPPDRTGIDFRVGGQFDIRPGDYVVVTNTLGATDSHYFETHMTVSDLAVTDVDLDTNTVSGIAHKTDDAPSDLQGQSVLVSACGEFEECKGETVTADPVTGEWSLTFPTIGAGAFIIGPNTAIETHAYDDPSVAANGTWYLQNIPEVQAWPAEDKIISYGWPAGARVQVSIDPARDVDAPVIDPIDLSTEGDDFGSADLETYIGGLYDLQPGDQVTLAAVPVAGFAIPWHPALTFEVQPLTFTVDTAGNTISGLTVPGAEVHARADAPVGSDELITQALENDEGDGPWSINFADSGFQLHGGYTGVVRVYGPDKGETVMSWTAPAEACPPGDSISGTVREHDGATPVSLPQIQVDDHVTGAVYCTTSGDANGHFSLYAPEGDYHVKASAPNHTYEYFDEAEDFSATVVHVMDGSPVSDVDFTLSGFAPYEHISFNLADPALNDLDVRRAIAFGTDRQRILDEAFLPNGTYGMVANSILPPGHWASPPDSAMTLYPYDPVHAQEILAAAGWTDTDTDGIRENAQGAKLEFGFKTRAQPDRIAAAELFAQNMREIGIGIHILYISPDDFFPQIERGEFQIVEFGWANSDDSWPFGWAGYGTGQMQNWWGYSNPAFDELMQNISEAGTDEEKIGYYAQAFAILSQDLPTLPMFTRYPVSPVETPVGEDIALSLGSQVTVRYDTVTASGVSAAIASPAEPANLPPNFQVLGQVYDVGTTAQFSSAQLCFAYADAGMTPEQEQQVRLFHQESGEWVDVTDEGYPHVADDIVCGTVSSFSPFVIAYALNTAPVIDSTYAPTSPVKVNTVVNVGATFIDPDAGDAFTALWDWGDGSALSLGQITGNSVIGSHTYAQPGIYTVKLGLTDNNGGSDEQEIDHFIVVYDPSGGFVTGGGWFIDVTSGGKASFGANAKYLPKSSIPSGGLEFKLGDLGFKSSSFDWLVLSGAKAQVKGTGTIGDGGLYGFMLTLVDGQPSGGADLIRIRIWEVETGATVYNSEPGSGDAALPTLAVQGGSIVIHR